MVHMHKWMTISCTSKYQKWKKLYWNKRARYSASQLTTEKKNPTKNDRRSKQMPSQYYTETIVKMKGKKKAPHIGIWPRAVVAWGFKSRSCPSALTISVFPIKRGVYYGFGRGGEMSNGHRRSRVTTDETYTLSRGLPKLSLRIILNWCTLQRIRQEQLRWKLLRMSDSWSSYRFKLWHGKPFVQYHFFFFYEMK